MSRNHKTLFAAACAVTLVGCGDFLSGDKLDRDPNRATTADEMRLLVPVQVNTYYIVNGHAARVLAMWTQQMAGTDRQYSGYDQYAISEGLFFEFSSSYTGGGLIDLRAIQAAADKSGNKTLGGIAKVWEALIMSFVADMYGDVPYSEAVRADIATPKLDKQVDVYAALQTVLTSAIADLNAGVGGVVGVGGGRNPDLWYAANRSLWIKAAHTLKARLYLHTAEVNTAAYASALAEAQQGISSSAGDLNEYHSAGSGEENIWWQFIFRDRDSYMRPGKFLVDLMKTRNDPRLPHYFSLNENGQFGGAAPGQGLDPTTMSNVADERLVEDFPQPILTWLENQSIIAEAAYRTGNIALARTTLDAIRASYGAPAIGAGLSGTALLVAILQEKYIALFQNYEVYNDWKRTCYPNLTPASNAFQGNIPARFTYPVGERSTNPNVPALSAQPSRNQNDPVTTTSADGTACKGQK